MKKSAKSSPRLAAMQTLGNVLVKNLNMADGDATGSLADSRDRALAKHLSYGVLRWLSSLQWLSGQLLDRPLKSRDRDISHLILIGLYQLWQDGTAQHAAIHETAECARLQGKPWAVGLVNAVLRRFQREQQKLLDDLEQVPERFAHPAWLLQQLQSDWPEEWLDIVQANNCAAPLWLRINRLHSDQHEITGRLEDADFKLETQPFAADAVCITPTAGVNDIPGFQEGLLSVQDPAAQLAVDLLELESQHHVLDACAAPGGKTCHVLERYPSVEMSAIELKRPRLDLVRENVERLGFGHYAGLTLIAGDAAETTGWWDGKLFDRILLDAPCTATGVIRRHPEVKWLRSRAQLEEAVRLQERLLRQLWPLLQVGGILVYATCSVLKDENSKQINAFLASHDDSEALPMAVTWGHDLGCGRQILPGEAGMDGFFYARLRKVF